MYGIVNFVTKLFWLSILIIFSLIIASLVGSNTQMTTLSFWPIPGQITIVFWLAILLAFSAGLIFGSLLIWLNSISSYRLARQIQKQKKINATLKAKPGEDSHLLFDQQANNLALNGEKGKQSVGAFTQGP